MARASVLILRAAGTNCDRETQYAWELAGASVARVHLRRLIEQPALLDRFQVATIPGGFSYGDDIAAGRIFAAQVRRHLVDQLRAIIDAGKLVLGICNGFQILVQAGLLPDAHDGLGADSPAGTRTACTVTYNDPPGFQDRWVTLQANDSPCVFVEPGRRYEMPIAHAEGRVVFADDECQQRVTASRQNALCYVPAATPAVAASAGAATEAVWLGVNEARYNPNGSQGDVAGLCDPTGRVLGLMPHPERFVTWTQHPGWTSEPQREVCDGLALFQRALAYFE